MTAESIPEIKSIRDLLASGKTYVGLPFGSSMWPMLRNKRDTIVVEPVTPDTPLATGDVAAFTRGDQIVLHRIVAIKPDGYLFWGDNCASADGVIPRDRVIGVLTGYFRDNRPMGLTSRRYHAYVATWAALRPARVAWKKVRASVASAVKKR